MGAGRLHLLAVGLVGRCGERKRERERERARET